MGPTKLLEDHLENKNAGELNAGSDAQSESDGWDGWDVESDSSESSASEGWIDVESDSEELYIRDSDSEADKKQKNIGKMKDDKDEDMKDDKDEDVGDEPATKATPDPTRVSTLATTKVRSI